MTIIADRSLEKARNNIVGFALKSDHVLYFSFFIAFYFESKGLLSRQEYMILFLYLSFYVLLISRSAFVKNLLATAMSKYAWRSIIVWFSFTGNRKRGRIRRRTFLAFGLIDTARANVLHLFLPFMPATWGGTVLIAYRLFGLMNFVSLAQNLYYPQKFASRLESAAQKQECCWEF